MAGRSFISLEEAEELQRLYAEMRTASKRAADALQTQGAPLEGMPLQRYRDEEAKVAAIWRRIREIYGTEGQHWMTE
jgi:hypothetical protein